MIRGKKLISEVNMGCGWLCPIVKFRFLSQQDSFCIITLLKFSHLKLFDSHWQMWSLHRSEKILKLIYPGSFPQA